MCLAVWPSVAEKRLCVLKARLFFLSDSFRQLQCFFLSFSFCLFEQFGSKLLQTTTVTYSGVQHKCTPNKLCVPYIFLLLSRVNTVPRKISASSFSNRESSARTWFEFNLCTGDTKLVHNFSCSFRIHFAVDVRSFVFVCVWVCFCVVCAFPALIPN